MDSQKKELDWSSEKDEILIDFVKNHDILYNVQLNDYKKVQFKKSLWQEIGGILNKTDTDCSKRWAYIRDYYVKRRGKPGTGSSGEAAKKRSEQLSFLDTLPSRKRRTITNIGHTDILKNSADELSRKDDNIEEHITDQMHNDDMMRTEEGQILEATPPPKQRCLSSKSKNSEERMKLLRQISERQQHTQIQDETDLFFAAIVKVVKKLPEKDRAEIRLKISNLVGNAEIRYLSRPTSDYRPLSASSFNNSNASFENYLPAGGYSSPEPSGYIVIIPDNSSNSNFNFSNISFE